jgi:outer membrane lipopolysaccharide assembly protein LptE/RlpB
MTDKKPTGKIRKTGIVQKETEELQALISEIERDTSNHLIEVLQSIIKEQVQGRNLHRETGSYIIDAVREECKRKGWID